MVSGLSNLAPLILLPIIIVPGIVGLKIRLYVSHRTDSYGRLDSTVYSWTLSTVSIFLLYVWIYLATGSVDLIPEFLRSESISNLNIITIVGIYALHFVQCLALGAFIGAFAYNYIDPPRLSVRETKRDLIFKHIGRGSDVEIRTKDGDTIQGYVGKSFNRGKGEGVILSGPERVCGPEVDGKNHTEDMGQYVLIKESNIAHASVEGDGIDPEKTKDDPDKLQDLISQVEKDVFPTYTFQYIISPPRRFLVYSFFLFGSTAIVGLLGSLIATHIFSAPRPQFSLQIETLVVVLMSLLMFWFSDQQIWSAINSKGESWRNKANVVKYSLLILIPVISAAFLFQVIGTSRVKAISMSWLVSYSAVYLGLKYRTHSHRVWGDIGETGFYYFSIISLTSQLFFLLTLAIFGRSSIENRDLFVNIESLILVLSLTILSLLSIIFMEIIEGGPSKKRSLPKVFQSPTIIIFETVSISILVIFALHLLFSDTFGYQMLVVTGFVYSISILGVNYFAYDYKEEELDNDTQEYEPPEPAF